MNRKPDTDLHQVRAQFENWRRTRQRKERIPAALWSAVHTLLERYPVSVVRRELSLSTQQLARRRKQPTSPSQPPAFLALSAQELNTLPPKPVETQPPSGGNECLAVIERRDGGKLSLRIPVSSLGTVISSFVGA